MLNVNQPLNLGCGGGSTTANKEEVYKILIYDRFCQDILSPLIGVKDLRKKYRNFRKVKRDFDKSKWTLMSFHKLGFREYEILDALDEDNVIESGSSGKVYKVVLSNGEAVAVKKLWGSSKITDESFDIEKEHAQDDGFAAEVETLGKIRHKNIVKLWYCCTTRDCTLLVYEYMPNGSLGYLLQR